MENEAWSWRKLIKGPITGKNYGKALVLTFCQAVIIGIVLCVIFTARNVVWKNSGNVNQNDVKNYSIFNLLKVG